MKRKIIYLGCFFMMQFTSSQVFSQDVIFSSSEFTHGAISPALIASNNSIVVTAGTRSQWKKFGGAYNTINASGEFAFKKNKNKSYLATGVDVYTDNSSSSLTTNSLKGNLAYHLQLNPYDKLSVGMYLGYLGFNSNLDKERWGSQYNGIDYSSSIASGETFSSIQKSVLDVGFGAVLSSKTDLPRKNPTFQVGLSAFHLNRPTVSFLNDKSQLPIRVSGFINTSFVFGRVKNEIKPSINVQIQNKFVYIMFGSMVCLNKKVDTNSSANTKKTESISAGLFYRSSGALVSMVSCQKDSWNIGLSYDLNFGNRLAGLRSATEINLRYLIP